MTEGGQGTAGNLLCLQSGGRRVTVRIRERPLVLLLLLKLKYSKRIGKRTPSPSYSRESYTSENMQLVRNLGCLSHSTKLSVKSFLEKGYN